MPVFYDQLGKCLCADCAIEEYENGNYYETCECCGKQFNPESEHEDFNNQVSYKVYDADMYQFGIYCADCAAKELLDSLDDDDDDSYNDDESLDVYNAALIWLSHGKDEDYTFGYTEEELEEALD